MRAQTVRVAALLSAIAAVVLVALSPKPAAAAEVADWMYWSALAIGFALVLFGVPLALDFEAEEGHLPWRRTRRALWRGVPFIAGAVILATIGLFVAGAWAQSVWRLGFMVGLSALLVVAFTALITRVLDRYGVVPADTVPPGE